MLDISIPGLISVVVGAVFIAGFLRLSVKGKLRVLLSMSVLPALAIPIGLAYVALYVHIPIEVRVLIGLLASLLGVVISNIVVTIATYDF